MDEFIEIIDYEGNLKHDLGLWFTERNIQCLGFNYSVVTVLGCQSSGKSTLLNALFGTKFPVMDACLGRSQTTKGIWLAVDSKSSTLVFDVEGTDSRERGEDRLTFEHRSALFSLALADCVLVNMWYHDLGRYTASNYGLLKTVLGVNLDLFQKGNEFPKTTLIFIIRDYTENLTPLETLKKMIHEDIRRLWKETPKPPCYIDSTPDDFFEFQILGLPSKIERPEEFKTSCGALREKWLDTWRAATYTRGIPFDGFPMYCQQVWKTIVTTADLDIPSQKEMLATYRCDELKIETLNNVSEQLDAFHSRMIEEKMSLEDITSLFSRIRQVALESYDGPGCRYESKIYKKKRIQLIQSLRISFQKIADELLTLQRRSMVDACSKKFSEHFDHTTTATSLTEEGDREKDLISLCQHYTSVTQLWKKEALDELHHTIQALAVDTKDQDISQYLQLDLSHHVDAFLESFNALKIRFHDHLLQNFKKDLHKKVGQSMGNLERYLMSPDLTHQGFWSDILKLVNDMENSFRDKVNDVFLGMGDDIVKKEPEEFNIFLMQIISEQLGLKLKTILDYLVHIVLKRFQLFFHQDNQQTPRQWKSLTSNQIKEIYVDARQKSLNLLTVFTDVDCPQLFKQFDHLRKESGVIDSSFLVVDLINEIHLSESDKDEILLKAQHEMLKSYQEAQMLQATVSHGGRIPWWIWGLLVILGYNELMMVFTSPFLFILVILCGLLTSMVTYNNGNLIQNLITHLIHILSPVCQSFLPYLNPPGFEPNEIELTRIPNYPDCALKKEH